MAYVIYKLDGTHEMWLRTDAPAVTWSTRDKAKIYFSTRIARTALAQLPQRHRDKAIIVDVG